jgi:hypothetical protein
MISILPIIKLVYGAVSVLRYTGSITWLIKKLWAWVKKAQSWILLAGNFGTKM